MSELMLEGPFRNRTESRRPPMFPKIKVWGKNYNFIHFQKWEKKFKIRNILNGFSCRSFDSKDAQIFGLPLIQVILSNSSFLPHDAFVTFIWIRHHRFLVIFPLTFTLFDIPPVISELLERIIYISYDIINCFAVNVLGLTISHAITLHSITSACHDKGDITQLVLTTVLCAVRNIIWFST